MIEDYRNLGNSVEDENNKISLVIILGPTASGKTDLAVRLAERFDGEIVNADSMQVYRGMDIGTAKPPLELRQRIPHHLIDIVGPEMNFSAADFRREATRAIADITGRGKTVFIVGGTGLYIRALLQGLVDSPSGAGEVRQELEERAKSEGNEALLRELSRIDPATAARLHPNDLVRIIRALEVYRLTGRPISQERSAHGFSGDYYRTLKIGLTCGAPRTVRKDRPESGYDDRRGAGGGSESIAGSWLFPPLEGAALHRL